MRNDPTGAGGPPGRQAPAPGGRRPPARPDPRRQGTPPPRTGMIGGAPPGAMLSEGGKAKKNRKK